MKEKEPYEIQRFTKIKRDHGIRCTIAQFYHQTHYFSLEIRNMPGIATIACCNIHTSFGHDAKGQINACDSYVRTHACELLGLPSDEIIKFYRYRLSIGN